MKRKALITIVASLILVCGWTLNGLGSEPEGANLSFIYGAFVDNYIQKCVAKAEMLDSGSVQIRKNALRATVKGAYLQSNRAGMIAYLMEKNAPLNADRIAYHLNRKYADSVFPREVYAALLNDYVHQ